MTLGEFILCTTALVGAPGATLLGGQISINGNAEQVIRDNLRAAASEIAKGDCNLNQLGAKPLPYTAYGLGYFVGTGEVSVNVIDNNANHAQPKVITVGETSTSLYEATKSVLVKWERPGTWRHYARTTVSVACTGVVPPPH